MNETTPYPYDQPTVYLDDTLVGDTPNLPTVRLEWNFASEGRKIGLVNGFVVYTVQSRRFEGPGTREWQIFHRLPVAPIDKTFRTSDEAKLYADTHLHRAMRQLGFVAR